MTRAEELIERMAGLDTKKRLNTVNRLERQVELRGGNPNAANNPSTVERIFDVLSRPNYAVAGAVDSALSGENPLRGAWDGLSGRDKTDFSDVLGEHTSLDGPLKHVLGFGLDVALDPTTYFGGAFVKGSGKLAAERVGSEAVAKAFKKGDDGLSLINSKAREAYLKQVDPYDDVIDYLDAVDMGTAVKKLKPEQRLKFEEVQKNYQQLQATAMRDIYHEAVEKAGMEGVGQNSYMQFTWGIGGKKVSANLESKFLSETGRKIMERKGIKDTVALFKNPTVDGGLVNERRRILEGKFRNSANEAIQGYKEQRIAFDLTKDEARRVRRTLEGLESNIDNPKIQEAVDFIRDEFKAIYAIRAGLKQPNLSYVENYLPRHFKKGSEGNWKEYKKKYKTLEGERFRYTIDDAKAAGLEPIEDPFELLARERMDVSRTQIRRVFEDELVDNYGFILDDVQLKRMDKNEISQFAEEMGMRPVKLNREGKPVAFLPKDVDDAFKTIQDLWSNTEKRSELEHMIDGAVNTWKALATVVNPGHHVRNMYGDFFMSYVGGVSNPKYWKQAANVMKSVRESNPGKIKLSGGVVMDNQKLMDTYKELGLKQGYFDIDAVEAIESNFLSKGMQGFIGAGQKVGESRETFTRFGHFIGQLDKELAKYGKMGVGQKEFDRAATIAARKTKKNLIDYGDLTGFEQSKMKRLIPFYTFMRKNFPLMVEAMMFQPGKIAGLTKGQRALNGLLGNEAEPGQELENIVPKWIRDGGMPLYVTGGEQPVVLNPELPFQEAFERFDGFFDTDGFTPNVAGGVEGFAQSVASTTNPVLKGLFEAGTGVNTFTGGQSELGVQTLTNQFVPVRNAGKIAEGLLSGDAHDAGIAIAQVLGAPIRPVDYNVQQGELRRQEDVLNKLLKALDLEAQSEAANRR